MLVEGETTSSSAGDSDRGCPLDTGIVRPMWHACGTDGKDQRGLLAGRRQGEAFREDPTLLEPDRYVQSMLMHWAGLPLPAAWLPPPSITPGTASMPRS